ncbi:hypothetical protein [Nostoc sp. FACHB-110]|uniref:hypothetical protein n=1 Tax=Nostoc sp. FACHB-110 TaxID=2692834 RepID=UPI0016832DFA|nr:hypothetical protein [Nostoc sp. FACHB-110]
MFLTPVGDITEVFDKIRQLHHTGVIVRAAHNRSLDSDSERLWSKLEAQPISFEQEIELPSTQKRSSRQAKLAIRFCAVNLRTPYRFDNRDLLPLMKPEKVASQKVYMKELLI